MKNDEHLYIEDDQGRKLYYHFTPCAIASNFVPLIVILDDNAVNFEYKMWNVLTPIDIKKDVYYKELLQTLIKETIEDNECEDHIYFYGSGANGHEAISQSILSKANAVYTQDLSTINEKTDINLCNLLNASDIYPIFYVCSSSEHSESNRFVNTCKSYDIKHHVNRCVKVEDKESDTIKEVLNMFERMVSQT